MDDDEPPAQAHRAFPAERSWHTGGIIHGARTGTGTVTKVDTGTGTVTKVDTGTEAGTKVDTGTEAGKGE